jgi:hypothetical protein
MATGIRYTVPALGIGVAISVYQYSPFSGRPGADSFARRVSTIQPLCRDFGPRWCVERFYGDALVPHF